MPPISSPSRWDLARAWVSQWIEHWCFPLQCLHLFTRSEWEWDWWLWLWKRGSTLVVLLFEVSKFGVFCLSVCVWLLRKYLCVSFFGGLKKSGLFGCLNMCYAFICNWVSGYGVCNFAFRLVLRLVTENMCEKQRS